MFVRTTSNSIVEVFLAHQSTNAKFIYMEKITFIMPTDGAADSISTKHW